MNANSQRRRAAKFAALIFILAALYAILTSEIAMGRRFAKLAAYRCDFRYWPFWYSAILWTVALGFLSAFLVRREPFRGFVARLSRRLGASEARAEEPSKRGLRFVAFFYGAALVAILCWLFVDFKPIGRFLRYKVYGDFFRKPVELWLETGEISVGLLTTPILFVVLLLAFWRFKKRGPNGKLGESSQKLGLVFLILCPLTNAVAAAEPGADAEIFGKITVLEPAKRAVDRDVDAIAATPSAKNPDGGYDADVSILQCFAVASYRYTGGRYDDEEIRFRLRFPPRVESGKTYPLLIWLHGYGESTGDNERHLAHLHRAIAEFSGKDALDFYMIAVQCPPDNASWERSLSAKGKGDSRLAIVGEIMDAAVEAFPIDANRIGVVGISSGASATWEFVERNPGKIAGLVAFSGTPATADTTAFRNVAIWAFNNRGDVGASWEKTAEFVGAINSRGGNACVTLRDHGIHDSWSIPLENQNVIGWLAAQSLDGSGPVQDVPYPKRSWPTLFFAFLLPIGIIAASAFGLFLQSGDETKNDDEKNAPDAPSEIA